MSCNLLEFYNSLSEKESAKYQSDPNCYYFDPFIIVARINAYSKSFFQVQNQTVHIDKSVDGIELCPYGECKSNPSYDVNTNGVHCSNDDLFYHITSTYKKDHANKYAQCYILPVAAGCTIHLYFNLSEDVNAYCTELKFPDQDNFPTYRCVSGNCIINSTFPNKNFCPSSADTAIDCVIKSTTIPSDPDNYNILTPYDPDQSSAIAMTIEMYQDLPSQPIKSNLTNSKSWRQKLNGPLNGMENVILPTSFYYPLYIISYVFSITQLFYYQIYNDYSKNDFNSIYVVDPNNDFEKYLKSLVSLSAAPSSIPFSKSINDPSLYSKYFCILPKIKDKGNNNFQVEVFFNYDIYNQIKGVTDKLTFLQGLMKNILDDGESPNVTFLNNSTNTNIPVTPASYKNLNWDPDNMSCTYFDFSDYDVNSVNIMDYLVTNKTLSQFLNISEDNKMVFLINISTTMDINSWSPMLYVYAKSNFNVPSNVTQSFASILYKDTNGLYPTYDSFSKDICGNKNYYDCYYDTCEYTFVPSSKRCSIPYDAAELFMTMSKDCACIKTNITPVNVSPQYANKTSMCYSKDCTDEQLKKFNINKQYCKNNCDDVTNWLNNPDKSYKLQNSKKFNTDRYGSYCLQSNSFPFNYYYFIIIWISFIAISLLISMKIKKRRLLTIFLTTFNVVALGVSIFMGFFLSGNSFCSNQKTVCYSNLIRSVQLTSSCCDSENVHCQCDTDSDCNDENFYCGSGSCVPYTEVDYNKTTKKVYPVYDILVFGINFLLVLLTLIFYIKTYRIEKTMIIIGIVGFYAICFILLQTYYWKEVKTTYERN